MYLTILLNTGLTAFCILVLVACATLVKEMLKDFWGYKP